MDALYKLFPEDSKEFPWDETILEEFKKIINENELKCRMDDTFLLGILRARKFNLERSLQLLKNYYTRRNDHPSFFKNLLPSKLERVLSLNYIKVIPKPDQNGRIIVILEAETWDVSETTVLDLYRVVFLYIDLLLNLHRLQENGLVAIINSRGTTFGQFLQFTPKFINNIVTLVVRDAYQLRLKELHFVNINPIVKVIVSILIPFLPVKIRKRLFVHTGVTTLSDFVNPEYLPEAYGGTLPDFDPNEFMNVVKQNEDFFRENEESLKTYNEAVQQRFSEGNFKYINPDSVNYEEKLIEESEEKFKMFKEDPENFTKYAEESAHDEVVRL
ncbi:alpha-tocopherol transfer protein-like [Centruroides sculpturatus]|uniref:alpha-tocopherol transfer protein-like n=1 Tax=Centruroides sculpturatus TaxID=218467 RepID=UPI000C6CE332|nr:alpha-tocopherol transfer protein-like [Centruroides sculpturatus]XP_023232502.1 alpha-tocopherol transfer protein-like [Centruroides sculpturatus]XP_023232503.1 alpha-tocopherol transfer protein-like [Centruroides sculpturatus]XP_023232504.1 alpha-tocopherol transfer protein-like [Centruroides sculpturatus]XP_023232505.1 alpha-tocopherol transfer protein-like [Centruroides sculpturatus]XP_023232506.1 alpha-tocopherol transfer protein-like [Centruroides sculpturatus]